MSNDANQEARTEDGPGGGQNRRALLQTIGAGAVAAGFGTASAAAGERTRLVESTRPLSAEAARQSLRAVSTDERVAVVRSSLEAQGLTSELDAATSTRLKLTDAGELADRAPALTAIPYHPTQTESGGGAVGLLYAVTVAAAGGRSVATTLGFSAVEQPAPMSVGASASVTVRIHGPTTDTQTVEQRTVTPSDIELPDQDEITCTLCEVLSVVVCSLLGEFGDDLCSQICSGNDICQTACEAIVDFADQEFCRNPESICTGLGFCSESIR